MLSLGEGHQRITFPATGMQGYGHTSRLLMNSGTRSRLILRWMCAWTRCLKAGLRSRSKPTRAMSMFTAASTGADGSAARASLLLKFLLFLRAALAAMRPAATSR
jgi:hypothetical protein